jgi:hypothetical protein
MNIQLDLSGCDGRRELRLKDVSASVRNRFEIGLKVEQIEN